MEAVRTSAPTLRGATSVAATVVMHSCLIYEPALVRCTKKRQYEHTLYLMALIFILCGVFLMSGRHGNTTRSPAPIKSLILSSMSTSVYSLLLLPPSSPRRHRWVWRVPGGLWWRPVHQHAGDVPVPVLRWLHVIGGHEDVWRWGRTLNLQCTEEVIGYSRRRSACVCVKGGDWRLWC